jgi:hypothetical protein
MSIRDRLRGGIEQLAPSTTDENPAPRGEHRTDDRRAVDEDDGIVSFLLGSTLGGPDDSTTDTERRSPPEKIDEYWRSYYKEFALTRAPLNDFSSSVVEPGYQIEATVGGDVDEDMTEALEVWAENCVIHAGELGHDLRILLEQLPKKRRGKGTQLVETVGTDTEPNALVALMPLDPATFKIHTRERQPILVQPSDDVDSEHPRTPTGEAAAYTQYHEDVPGHKDEDPIHFDADEVIKLTWDVDDGDVWGTSAYEAIDDRIDALIQKLDDRDFAIRQTGYPHRIYSSENWSLEEAEAYAEAHAEGDVSDMYGPDDTQGDRGGEKQSFAGRVDFVPHTVEVQVETGSVPDIEDPIRDDVEQIFAVMPVGKYQIAYADDLNQFVVDPQREKDAEAIDDERRYLERKFEPVFREKADELASGDRYEGEVSLTLEPPKDENPLRREGFPADNLVAFANAWQKYQTADGGIDLPAGAFADLAGIDLEDLQEQFEFEADPLEIPDEADIPENTPPPPGAGEGGPPDEGSADDDVDEAEADDETVTVPGGEFDG